MWHRILLLSLDTVDEGLLEALATLFSERTPLEVDVEVEKPADTGWGDRVLGRRVLQGLPSRDDTVVLGVTATDLYTSGRLYVFGQGALGHGLAVVSLYRLLHAHHGWSPSREVLLERLYRVALHETGHAMGLSHCDGVCVMRVCSSVYQLDRVPGDFCPKCASKLGWR